MVFILKLKGRKNPFSVMIKQDGSTN